MNILHIEQSMLIREMMHDVTVSVGHEYTSAKSCEDAFQVLESEKIDFIITGLELADTSGEDFIEALLKSEYKDIPVIVLTSTDTLDIRKKLFDLGAVDFIVKDSITDEKLRSYFEALDMHDDVIDKMKDRSIAVLDDNQLVTILIKNILDLHGIKNVDTYHTAEDLLASSKNYSVYILDLVLPGKSGKDVLMALRQKSVNSVIILISSISNYKTISNILSSGADDFILKPFDAGVFMARIRAHSRNFILREELEKANLELEKAAITDGLTQIYNHRYIVNRVDEEIESAKESGAPLTLFLFDIDDFKHVNDRYGHQTGDMVLRAIAGTMKDLLRSGDAIGRYGGEEFLVVMANSDSEASKQLGERIRQAVEDMVFQYGDLKVTLSGGGAVLNKHTATELIKLADQGLYKAKNGGKNWICFIEEDLSEAELNKA